MPHSTEHCIEACLVIKSIQRAGWKNKKFLNCHRLEVFIMMQLITMLISDFYITI